MSAGSALSRAGALSEVSAAIERRRRLAEEQSEYASRLATLARVSQALGDIRATAHLLLDQGAATSAQLRSLSHGGAATAVAAFRTAIGEDPSHLIRGSEYPQIVSLLEEVAREAKQEVWGVWVGFLDGLAEAVTDEEIGLFKLTHPSTASALTRARAQLNAAKRTLPHLVSDITEVQEQGGSVAKLRQEAWSALVGPSNSELPEAVRAFLEAVAEPAGASLEMLTVEVRDWLNDTSLASRFRVVVGAG